MGPILISINPYRWYEDTYSDKTMDKYHLSERGRLPPHLFEVRASLHLSPSGVGGVTQHDCHRLALI